VFTVRLVSVVAVVGLAAAVVVCGVYVYQNWQSWTASNPSSSPAAIDYNCNLPGTGFPWLERDYNPHPALGGAPYHMGGIYVSTVSGQPRYGVALPVRIKEDGTPPPMADVYRMLCAVHPDLGGSGLRPMTLEERRGLDFGDRSDTSLIDQVRYMYTEGVARATDEAHIGFGQIRVYYLPPIPQGLRDALSTPAASPPAATPTATPTPALRSETRRYRITVTGYENRYYWTTGERVGVRFDYRLIGEFVLERSTPSKPWTVASRRVVTAELTYSSLYPADRYQVTLDCTRLSRSCQGRLIRSTTLRLRVEVDGDEIIVRWGGFRPEVLVAGSGPSPLETVSYLSESFDDAIAGERLPLQDQYVGPQRVTTYQGRSDILTSHNYGLERLP